MARGRVSTRTERLGLALAAASAAGLTANVVASRRAGAEMAAALAEVGVTDPAAGLPLDWRATARPFRMVRPEVRRVATSSTPPAVSGSGWTSTTAATPAQRADACCRSTAAAG